MQVSRGFQRALEAEVRRLVEASPFELKVLLAMDRLGIDMWDFAHRMRTGRLWNDYEVGKLIGSGGKLSNTMRMINKYMSQHRGRFDKETDAQLLEKKRLDRAAISKAKKIKAILAKKARS